jgi:hypothetical protein
MIAQQLSWRASVSEKLVLGFNLKLIRGLKDFNEYFSIKY